MHFSYKDYLTLNGRYVGVAAVPIVCDEAVRGVVSLDGRVGLVSYDDITSSTALDYLAVAAEFVAAAI